MSRIGFTSVSSPRALHGFAGIPAPLLNRMVESGPWVERNGRRISDAVNQLLQGAVVFDWYLAKTVSAASMGGGTANRFTYGIEGEFVDEDNLLTDADRANWDADDVINAAELLNDDSWVYPGIDPTNLPPGYAVLPVGGTIEGDHHGAPVMVYFARRTDGSLLRFFFAPNPIDGTCGGMEAVSPLVIDGGEISIQLTSHRILGRVSGGVGYAEELELDDSLTFTAGKLAAHFGSIAGRVCEATDARLSDARTPLAHAASHGIAGTDAVTPAAIGAAIVGRTISAGTGLTGGGDLSANRSLAADFGSGAGKVTEATDVRLSDARTPTAHASTHKDGGSDEIATTTAASGKIPKASGSGKLDKAWIPDFVASGGSHASGGVPDPGGSAGTTRFLREDGWAVPAPPGSNTQVVYNNSGAFGASSSFQWDDSTKVISLAGALLMTPTSGANAIDVQQATLGSGYFLVLRYPDASQAGRIDGWGSLVFPGTNTFGDCALTAQSGQVGLKVTGAASQDVARIIDHSNNTQWKWTADGAAYDGNNNTLQRVSFLNCRETAYSQSVGSGGITIDYSNGRVQRLVLTNAGAYSPTFTFSNFPANGFGGELTLIIKSAATAITAVTWSGVTWDRNTAPTFVASKTIVAKFVSYYDGTPALIIHGWTDATGVTNPTN